MRGLFVPLCSAALVLSSAALLAADEKAVHSALARMLDAGWGKTAEYRKEGDAQAELALAAGGRIPQILYPVAVVYIKQGRYADALTQIDELLKYDASHLPGLRARAWLTAILKNYSQTMAAAEKLSAAMPAEEAASVENEAELREYVSFLGRLYGFLGGPVADDVNLSERKASERKISGRLTEGRRVLFEDARDSVLQKHLELTDAGAARREEAREAAAEAKAETLEDIAQEREERGERLDELKSRTDKLRQELKAELDEIAKEEAPFGRELAALDRRATSVNRELLTISSQIALLQTALDNENDPVRRAILLGDIDRLALIGSRYDADLVAINRQAAGVQQQLAGLAVRRRQAQASAGGQLAKINKEQGDLARREKRASAIEKRAERATPVVPASAISLRAVAGALATYDPFPLEQEKARILESLE